MPKEYREADMAILMGNEQGQNKNFLVTRVDAKSVTIDSNNPLCGREVIFRLKTLQVRHANEEAIAFSDKIEDRPDIKGVEGVTQLPIN